MVKFRKMLVNNKGFTLIELLVVIAVLGILAAIAIPRLTGFTDRARVSNLESSGQTVRSNVELYVAEYGVAPPLNTLTSSGTDYYVNIGDGYTLTSAAADDATQTKDGYLFTITDDNTADWNVEIRPGGLTINQPTS